MFSATASAASQTPRTLLRIPFLPRIPSRLQLVLFALGAAASRTFSATPPAVTAAPDPSVKLDAFTITGTYLDRAEAATTIPVTLLTADEIRARGGTTPAEWLATLPQAARVPITESQASGADARGDIGTVSLRGLGAGQTLVLLDGRRLAPHPISMPEGGTGVPSMAVNVNALPSAALERLEILRDGASALYGTDATAGVINLILRRAPSAPEARIHFLNTQHGAAAERSLTLAGGSDRPSAATRLAFAYSYLERDALRHADRDFARTADFRARAPAPWNGTTPELGADLRSDRGFFGRFQRGTVNPDGSVTGARPAGVTPAQVAANGTFYFVPAAPGVSARVLQSTEPDRSPASPVATYYLDVNAHRFLLPVTRRHNLHLALETKLAPRLTFFGTLVAYRADSENQREPTRIDATADNNITVAVDNPYNPFGSRFYSPTGAPNPDGTPRLAGTPSEVVITRLTLPEFGSRRILVRSETARLVAGLRGDLSPRWNWESALLTSAARTTDRELNAIKESELRDALARTTAATALNPFQTTFAVANNTLTTSGAPFANPESLLAPLRGTFFREGQTSLTSVDLRLRGQLANLPAGPLALAAGGEHRRETYQDFRDAESGRLTAADVQRLALRPSLVGDNNYLQISPTDNTDARRRVTAVFAELAVPLHRDDSSAAFRALELTLAARAEHTGDQGTTTKPKLALAARTLPGLTLRASASESFRAPNLAAVFAGAMQRSITGVNDAYRAAVTGATDDGPAARRVSLRTGSAALAPERARTASLGLGYEPPGLKGLSFAVDLWSIRQTDALTRLDAPDILAQDTALLTAANAAARATPLAEVDLSAAGSPNVLRHPVTAQDREAFAAYNSTRPRDQQRAPVGAIRAIAESYLNATRRDLRGLDFTVSYRIPATPFGTFRTTLEAAYLNRLDEQLTPTAAPTDLSWRDGNTRWKANLNLHWHRAAWSAGLFTQYTGRTQDSFLRTTATAPSVSPSGFLIVDESYTTNLHLSHRFSSSGTVLRDTTLRLGLNNAFDATPPFALGASSDTDGYLRGLGDPRGRAFTLELTRGF